MARELVRIYHETLAYARLFIPLMNGKVYDDRFMSLLGKTFLKRAVFLRLTDEAPDGDRNIWIILSKRNLMRLTNDLNTTSK